MHVSGSLFTSAVSPGSEDFSDDPFKGIFTEGEASVPDKLLRFGLISAFSDPGGGGLDETFRFLAG